jgi:hypothetical protein
LASAASGPEIRAPRRRTFACWLRRAGGAASEHFLIPLF